ncbi:MAG TPA: nitroreductase family protein [Thermomicrobiales bacterium]|nr:nitroreductase family protein [Thermomicrobiales bacterium]
MEFQDVVRKRRLYREFDPERPVPRELLERIVKNGRRAPSAGHSQGWGFLVLETPEDRATFWDVTNRPGQEEATGSPSMHTATAIIVPFANKQAYLDRYAQPDKGFPPNYEARWRIPHWYVDTAFASLTMLLSVVDAELGAIFFSVRDPAPLREAFGVPDGFDPIGAIALGYPVPSGPPARHGRRPVDEVIHWGRW